MPSLTPDELAVLADWFEALELPPPPFRSAPWVEIHEPTAWRAVMLRDLRAGPGNVYWHTALQELRWVATKPRQNILYIYVQSE